MDIRPMLIHIVTLLLKFRIVLLLLINLLEEGSPEGVVGFCEAILRGETLINTSKPFLLICT